MAGSAPSEQLSSWILADSASAFNECCRIYAPRYRQATMASIACDKQSGRLAYELAYADVRAAFEHFLAAVPPDEPFFIASHSQGGVHVDRLLEEVVGPSAALRCRLVACYLIGSKIPLDKLERGYPALHLSASPTDHTGCVVGWDTLPVSTGEDSAFSEDPGIWYASGWEDETLDKGWICTNPLTWDSWPGSSGRADSGWLGMARPLTSPANPLIANREFFNGSEETRMRLEVLSGMEPVDAGVPQSAFFAEATRTSLLVPELPEEGRGPFRGIMGQDDNYHTLDYSLFYWNIRHNVRQRLEAFLASRASAPRTRKRGRGN